MGLALGIGHASTVLLHLQVHGLMGPWEGPIGHYNAGLTPI